MAKADDIKIRTLPRQTEKKAADKEGKKPVRWIIYVGTTSAIFLATVMLLPTPAKKSIPRSPQHDLASVSTHINDAVNRHLQDADIQTAMMKRKRMMENLAFKNAINEVNPDTIADLPEGRSYGVQMDSDESAERVYEDLNESPEQIASTLPADKINSRLATRKWVNETERAERIQFVTNFVRSAYERGLQVEIDQNLVVVGVKRINPTQKVNINQVIDRLARQGL